MNIIKLMDGLPLWGIFLTSVGLIIISLELGFLLGKWDRGRLAEGEKIPTSLIIGASLSLLAFMQARLNPTLLDLSVAIISGIAAAYSKSFKQLIPASGYKILHINDMIGPDTIFPAGIPAFPDIFD